MQVFRHDVSLWLLEAQRELAKGWSVAHGYLGRTAKPGLEALQKGTASW